MLWQPALVLAVVIPLVIALGAQALGWWERYKAVEGPALDRMRGRLEVERRRGAELERALGHARVRLDRAENDLSAVRYERVPGLAYDNTADLVRYDVRMTERSAEVVEYAQQVPMWTMDMHDGRGRAIAEALHRMPAALGTHLLKEGFIELFSDAPYGREVMTIRARMLAARLDPNREGVQKLVSEADGMFRGY